MCTISIVPHADGFRMLCNRDELRTRPLAVPPRWRTDGRVAVTHPVDPLGGGTWIAVSGEGMAVALLNRQCRRKTVGPTRSRGELPLALIDASGLADARHRLGRIDPAAYSGFMLVVVSFHQLLLASSDGVGLTLEERELTGPAAFTSSSLGDEEAERARLPLFQSLVARSRDPWSGQRAFHDHQWHAQPELSVVMHRPDACTVSRTRVDVRGGRVAMDY